MSNESNRQEPMAPFLYAIVYQSGEVFATHKNPRVAELIANMEREWNPCEVITLYVKQESLTAWLNQRAKK